AALYFWNITCCNSLNRISPGFPQRLTCVPVTFHVCGTQDLKFDLRTYHYTVFFIFCTNTDTAIDIMPPTGDFCPHFNGMLLGFWFTQNLTIDPQTGI